MLNFKNQEELFKFLENNSKHYTPDDLVKFIHKSVKDVDFTKKRVLESSVGEGDLLLHIASKNNTLINAEIDVYDIEQSNLDITKEKLEAAGFTNVKYHLGDFILEDFEDEIIYDYAFQNPPFGVKIEASANDKWKDILGLKKNTFKSPEMAFLAKVNKISRRSFSILPLGITFRGNLETSFEHQTRKYLTQFLESITEFPGHMFKTTAIPTLLVELNRDKTDEVARILDTNKHFHKVDKLNELKNKDISEALKDEKEITFKEIEENNYNWMLKRYIEPEKEEVNVKEAAKEIDDFDKTLIKLKTKVDEFNNFKVDLFKLLEVEDD